MIESEKKKTLKKPNPILTEKLFLSDYDQFVKYRTIPVLFITHILLLIVSSYIVITSCFNRILYSSFRSFPNPDHLIHSCIIIEQCSLFFSFMYTIKYYHR